MNHKSHIKIILSAILVIVLLSVLWCFSYPESKEITVSKKNRAPQKISLIMAGDVLIHGAIYQDAKRGAVYQFDQMFEAIKPIIKDYDLAFYNQESIIGGKKIGLSTYPRFNSPEEIGDTMVALGFNLISLANNHTLDRGETAVLNSTSYWRSKNVMAAGSYASLEDRNQIKIKEKNGITYTLLAYTTVTNGLMPKKGKEYLTNIYSPEKVKNDIDKVKDQCDVIIVSMHWGEEYQLDYNKKQEEIATYLASLGVNLIIGHHPHVLQPIKYIGDTLVIYSLGNFISGQIGMDKLVGALVSLDIHKKNDTITMDNILVRLTYTYYDSSFHNFKVIPFDDLDDTVLNHYETYYTKYSNVIKGENTIRVAELR